MGDPAPPTTNLRRRRRISLPEHTDSNPTVPVEYRLTGYSQQIKRATATGTTARIYVPASWTGKRVALVLLDPPDDPSFENAPVVMTEDIPGSSGS